MKAHERSSMNSKDKKRRIVRLFVVLALGAFFIVYAKHNLGAIDRANNGEAVPEHGSPESKIADPGIRRKIAEQGEFHPSALDSLAAMMQMHGVPESSSLEILARAALPHGTSWHLDEIDEFMIARTEAMDELKIRVSDGKVLKFARAEHTAKTSQMQEPLSGSKLKQAVAALFAALNLHVQLESDELAYPCYMDPQSTPVGEDCVVPLLSRYTYNGAGIYQGQIAVYFSAYTGTLVRYYDKEPVGPAPEEVEVLVDPQTAKSILRKRESELFGDVERTALTDGFVPKMMWVTSFGTEQDPDSIRPWPDGQLHTRLAYTSFLGVDGLSAILAFVDCETGEFLVPADT